MSSGTEAALARARMLRDGVLARLRGLWKFTESADGQPQTEKPGGPEPNAVKSDGNPDSPRFVIDRAVLAEQFRRRAAVEREREIARLRPRPPPGRHWDFERTIFNPYDPVLRGLDPHLVEWFREHDIMPVAMHENAPTHLIRGEARLAFPEPMFGRYARLRGGREFER